MSIADVLPQSGSRSTRGRCPLYSFRMNDEVLDVNPQSATVSLADGKHDQVSVTVSSPTLTTTEGLTDQPVSFRWGVTPRVEPFNGYIMDVKEETAQGSGVSLTFTMSILGATKAMFDGKPHFWTNKTIPSAVKDLVSQNMLGFSGHPHTYVWPSLAQTNESDWGYVVSLADRLGWMLTNRYGVVACYDPVKLFTTSGSFTRLVMGGATGNNVQADRVLLDFQPIEEADAVYSNLGHEYGYFTSSNAVQIARQPGLFRGYTFATDVVVHDQDVAKVYVEADNASIDHWKQYAVARIWGDADIYPGHCVEVVTTNKAYLKAKYDGKWLVRQVNHSMDRQQYQTLLSLARPNGKLSVAFAAYAPFWQDPANEGKPKPVLYLDRTMSLASDSFGNPGTDLTAINNVDIPMQWASSWADRRGMIQT